MKAIDDFLQSLNERAKSTFYWGFIFSWLISNWKIILVFYSYENCGCTDGQIQCVYHYLNSCNSIIYPFIGACIYAGLIPFIDVGVFKVRDKAHQWFLKEKYGEDKLMTASSIQVAQAKAAGYDKLFKEKHELENQHAGVLSRNLDLTNEVEKLKKPVITLDYIFGNNQWRLKYSDTNPIPKDFPIVDRIWKINNNRIADSQNKDIYEVFLYKGTSSDEIEFVTKEEFSGKSFYWNFKRTDTNSFEGYVKLLSTQSMDGFKFKLFKVNSDDDNADINYVKIITIDDIFPGYWTLNYYSGDINETENIRIDREGKYYIDNVHNFNIEDLARTGTQVSFVKNRTDGTYWSHEYLQIIDSSLLKGTDDRGFVLVYSRIA